MKISKGDIIDLLVRDCQDTLSEFHDPAVQFGIGIAMGIMIKHLEEILQKDDET